MNPETLRAEIRDVLDRWIGATLDRDAAAYADLFSRDPEPFVVWMNGEASTTWKEVRDQALRDLNRGDVLIPRVDLFDLHAQEVGPDTVQALFKYEVAARDLWGTERILPRVATATLRRSKDGWKFVAAHFSAGKPPGPQ